MSGPAPKRPAKALIDIERLLQIVIGSSGHLPWKGTHPRELMMDGGYTVVPKATSRLYQSTGTTLSCPQGPDGRLVLAAVMELDGATAAMVIACAREERRPEWQPAMRRVPVARRCKKKHRKIVTGYKLMPPSEEAICQVREAYRRWHRALSVLAALLAGALETWQINGFRAPPEPWSGGREKAA